MSVYVVKTNKRDYPFEDEEVEFVCRRNAEGLYVEDNKGIYRHPRPRLLKLAVPIHFSDDEDEREECGLCYEPIDPSLEASQLQRSCSHSRNFHFVCVRTWIHKKQILEQPPTCPLCRVVIPID